MPDHPRRRLVGMALALCLVLSVLSCSTTPPAPASTTSADPLAHWKRARQGQASSPAVWLAYGDSITEGQGASGQSSRWIDETTAGLRTDPSSRDVGYLPGWYAVYGPDSTWQPYATRSGTIKNETLGALGQRTATMSTGASQTYRVTGTAADLYYLTGGGVLSYSVDEGAATTIDTTAPDRSPLRERIPFATPGSHDLTVVARTGNVFLAGVAVFDGDENSGVHLFDNAHSGYTSAQYVAAQTELTPFVQLAAPDLVTIELGVNDYLQGTASATEVQANLRALVTGLRAQLAVKTPSIVLVLPYRIGPTSQKITYRWDDYVAATTALGAELSVGVLDMSDMGTSAPGGLWASDGLHPSDTGNAEMARRATAYLLAG